MPELPLIEAAAVDANVELRPTWRGWIHAGTFPVAIAAGIAAGHAGLTRTTEVYGVAVVVLALVAVAALLRARRRAGTLAAAGRAADERDDRLTPAQLPG